MLSKNGFGITSFIHVFVTAQVNFFVAFFTCIVIMKASENCFIKVGHFIKHMY